MDLEKLIRKEANGLFSLRFDNERGLSRDEIEEIFSEFGYVVSVSSDEKERGCRFVRYQSHGDARYALDSLKDHPFIRFREQQQLAMMRNQAQKRLERQRSQQSNASSGRRSRKSSKSSRKESDASDYNNRSNHVRTASETTEDDNGFEFEYRRNRVINNKCNNGDSSEETSMPDLVGKDGQPVEENYKVIRNASDVVVGNVPPSLSEAFFLHLFEKWQPIAVSKMEIVPRTNRRYCHVYFKTAQDAEDVEQQFDGHILQETSLVVMRPSALQNEAF